jgi:hypothetical protein
VIVFRVTLMGDIEPAMEHGAGFGHPRSR